MTTSAEARRREFEDRKKARAEADAKAAAELGSLEPTPTQEENDLAMLGLHPQLKSARGGAPADDAQASRAVPRQPEPAHDTTQHSAGSVGRHS
jgi:hypothetical protein